MSARIIFITGTDTGVGKTLLTALLLCHLRSRGVRALALKPFCSGGRADAELLLRLQKDDLTLDEINPFYFPEPVAPLISARKHKRHIPLNHVMRHIQSVAERLALSPGTDPGGGRSSGSSQNFLLIEGSGGLLVPLGENYTVRDLIARLACEVLIVARNRLGTINHTLLTVQALANRTAGSNLRRPVSKTLLTPHRPRVVLMDPSTPDVSSASNPAILAQLLEPIPLLRVPFLGPNCTAAAALKKAAWRIQKTLVQLASRSSTRLSA